jgi:hypothetical protein
MSDGPHRRATVGRTVVTVTAAAATVVAVVLGVSRLTRPHQDLPIRGTGTPTATATPTATVPADDLLSLTRQVKCRTPIPGAVSHDELAAFAAVTAVSCTSDTREIPGGGTWSVEVRRVATSGVPALQAAFERPDEPTPEGIACPAIAVVPQPLVLVDASGHTLVPSPPLDECHLPQQAFTTALDQVTWREVSVDKVQQVVTPQAQAANCAQDFKDMSYIEAVAGHATSSGGPVLASPPATVQVCVYRATEQDLEVGTFRRSVSLSADDTRRLLAALAGPGPTGSCPVERDFAVIDSRGGNWATVELGGCFRVAGSDSGLGTADPAVVTALLGGP